MIHFKMHLKSIKQFKQGVTACIKMARSNLSALLPAIKFISYRLLTAATLNYETLNQIDAVSIPFDTLICVLAYYFETAAEII